MTMNAPGKPRVGTYVIMPLPAAERPRILQHFLALDEADRALRFGVASDDDAVRRYVEGIDFDDSAVLGVADADGTLIGVAHLAFGRGAAELGLSIAPAARQRGLGRALSAAALDVAQERGAREFRLHCSASNDGMRRLAEILGMETTSEGSDLIARRLLGPQRSPAGSALEAVA
jgi:RimJ/RimL family protein N-acetyltransferase